MTEIGRKKRYKGRGAISNPDGRFETQRHLGLGSEGEQIWYDPEPDGDSAPPSVFRTEVKLDSSRSILSYNSSPDIPFDRSVNPYRGCEHGCVYCYARPTHSYLGLSPGLDFERKLFKKPDAVAQLRAALAARGYRPAPIILGANTDTYQPIEREEKITRGIVALLKECQHPLIIVTKSALVARDLDLLQVMAKDNLIKVFLSVTTLDRTLAAKMEPRATTPLRRLEAMAQLKAAGVPVGVMASPMIPGLNDHELEAILEAAQSYGASMASYVLLRLPYEVEDLFQEWLHIHYPLKKERILALIRECRSGQLNRSQFGERMRGTGVYAELLRRRFDLALRKLGFNPCKSQLAMHLFRPPKEVSAQGQLF